MKRHLFYLLTTLLITTIELSSCKEEEEDFSTAVHNSELIQVPFEIMVKDTVQIKLNPSGIAPLTASLDFNTGEHTKAEIKILGDIPVSNQFQTITNFHTLDIIGLYPDTINQIVLKISGNSRFAIDTFEITTDSLSAYLPRVEINAKNQAKMEEGMFLNTLSISDGNQFHPYPMIYDQNGVIRWYLNLEGIYAGFRSPMDVTKEGNLLFETSNGVAEFDFMGRMVKSVPIPNGYSHTHHDVYKMTNGNYLIPVDKDTARIIQNGSYVRSIEDIVIEIDGNSGALVSEWDLRYVLDVDRPDQVNGTSAPLTSDWFHMNAVVYSEKDDCIIVSGRNQAMVKLNRNNQLVWICAPHKGWGRAGIAGNGPETKPYLLTAVNSSGLPYDSLVQFGYQSANDFGWNWGQHAPLITPNGNVMLFDNGYLRHFTPGTYSRAVEYKIDESNMTVEQIWQYGKERGIETFAQIISDVDLLPESGNVLFCPGIRYGLNYSKIVEVTYPQGEVVFEGTLHFKNFRTSGGGFGQFDITYMAEKVNFYP